MKRDIKKTLLCFVSFSLMAAAPQEELQGEKPQTISTCHHWTKTVDRRGLQFSAEPLSAEVYCEKPDKVIVDRTEPINDDYSEVGSGSSYRHGSSYRSGRHHYGRR